MGSPKNQTTTQSNTPSPQAVSAYNNISQIASTAAATPLQQYQGARVAGFTPDQTAAFNNVESAQGIQDPYINAASAYAGAGAAPITNTPSVNYNGYSAQTFDPSQLSQFYNPYQQYVVNSTMANINQTNASQQNDLLGKAISSGASPFGGDRAGIAAAALSGQQALAGDQTIAGLRNSGYNTAL